MKISAVNFFLSRISPCCVQQSCGKLQDLLRRKFLQSSIVKLGSDKVFSSSSWRCCCGDLKSQKHLQLGEEHLQHKEKTLLKFQGHLPSEQNVEGLGKNYPSCCFVTALWLLGAPFRQGRLLLISRSRPSDLRRTVQKQETSGGCRIAIRPPIGVIQIVPGREYNVLSRLCILIALFVRDVLETSCGSSA